jgi:hypothetical protein
MVATEQQREKLDEVHDRPWELVPHKRRLVKARHVGALTELAHPADTSPSFHALRQREELLRLVRRRAPTGAEDSSY